MGRTERIMVNQDVGSMGRMSKASASQERGVNKGDSSEGETSKRRSYCEG